MLDEATLAPISPFRDNFQFIIRNLNGITVDLLQQVFFWDPVELRLTTCNPVNAPDTKL